MKTPSVSCSEFEEHAGSRERRPAESIYLECIAISLKVLLFCLIRSAQLAGPQFSPDVTIPELIYAGIWLLYSARHYTGLCSHAHVGSDDVAP